MEFMHPRNLYKNSPPNFQKLAGKYPDFKNFCCVDLRGKTTIDFKNPESIRALTRALLKNDFDLDVELPTDSLVPRIPLRLNYILWLEDIITQIPRDGGTKRRICGIDIGTGASCVYPLLGAKTAGWHFVATEKDPVSVEIARRNVARNNLGHLIEVVKVDDQTTLCGVVDVTSDRVFDFCMCNPPFYDVAGELACCGSVGRSGRPEPHSATVAKLTEVCAEGGEVGFVSRIIDDSVKLGTRVRLYTSMIGKKASLGPLKAKLRESNATDIYATTFAHGKAQRWALAWTFVKGVKLKPTYQTGAMKTLFSKNIAKGSQAAASTSRAIGPKLPTLRKVTETSRVDNGSSQAEVASGTNTDVTESVAASSQAIDSGNTLYFRDGKRRIDFVLAYDVPKGPADRLAKERARGRNRFERNLRKAGIDLEHEKASNSRDGRTAFVKLHGTWDFLQTQASALGIRIPLKVQGETDAGADREPMGMFRGLFHGKLGSGTSLSEQHHHITAAFDQRFVHYFNVNNQDTFFSGAQRSLMVWEFLLTATSETDQVTGIKQLIKNSTYTAAYPLHEELNRERKEERSHSDRQVLYDVWGNPRMYFKEQPLGRIRQYFGEKITLYFAWLAFYSKMLFPVAILGLICLIFGGASLFADIPSAEVCDSSTKGIGNTPMCPDGQISRTHMWNLNKTCLLSKVTYVFDNSATVVFSLVMSVWAMMFLDGWKQRQAMLSLDWGLFDADLEEDSSRSTNSARRLFGVLCSIISVIFFLGLVLALMFGVINYRITIRTQLENAGIQGMHAVAFSSLIAALANLVIILALEYAYEALAWYLTTWEYTRTEHQFEDSYALKVFLFQLVNNYSPLIYVAFIKGRFRSVVDLGKHSFESNAEMCDPAGCMVELFLDMAVIMLGKQVFSSCTEIFMPLFWNKWRQWRCCRRSQAQATISCSWERDYQLNEAHSVFMVNEYMKMAVQYGFVTLFVAAFPLAPFFALVNNLMEIRVDAYKFLVAFRRPVALRARDLRIWFKILDGIGYLAVLTNACVIAFTSDFVPRMLYKFFWSKDGTLAGYVESTLSWFDTRTGCASKMNLTEWSVCKLPYCRFHDYRNPPCSLMNANITFANCETTPDTYGHSMTWWHVMLARFLFVFAFENVVLLLKGAVSLLLPDVHSGVVARMQRDTYFEEHLLHKREMLAQHSVDAT